MNRQWVLIAGMQAALVAGGFAKTEANAFDASFTKSNQDSFWDRFRFGSYGELHGQAGDGDDGIDMHRLVGLMSVELTERLKFTTELEFEHVFYHDEGGGDENMQIEVEQAFFEYALRDDLNLTAGIQLIPVGIVCVTHEPTTFFGVERPNVEKYILPSTWWEGAIGLVKTYESGLQLDLMFHNAMDMTDDGFVRSGHEKMDLNQYTENQSWAVTGRAKYTGIAGVELASTLQYQEDVSTRVSGEQNAYMAEAHAIYRKGGFEMRALGAYWNLDGFNGTVTEDQWGYYLEPSYTFDIPWGKLGYFVRFSQYEYFDAGKKDITEYAVGLNYWPIDQVVVKTDYVIVDDGSVHDETISFGLGYHF